MTSNCVRRTREDEPNPYPAQRINVFEGSYAFEVVDVLALSRYYFDDVSGVSDLGIVQGAYSTSAVDEPFVSIQSIDRRWKDFSFYWFSTSGGKATASHPYITVQSILTRSLSIPGTMPLRFDIGIHKSKHVSRPLL